MIILLFLTPISLNYLSLALGSRHPTRMHVLHVGMNGMPRLRLRTTGNVIRLPGYKTCSLIKRSYCHHVTACRQLAFIARVESRYNLYGS